MKKIILLASVAFASGILFVNIFNSLVIAVALENDIPNSVVAAREFFKAVNPGTFFRIFAPITQVLALLSLILFWKKSFPIRLYLGIALLCYISADILTFLYFHPRNDIMFFSENLPDTETLIRVAGEWSLMNWVRSFIALFGLIFSFLSVHRIYSSRNV